MIGYLGKIWGLRHFWLALVGMDLRARYRRSMIGLGWSLLHPIAMATVLCVVFSALFEADIPSYGTFLLAGLVTWIYIVSVVNQGCLCFFANETYIRQHPAPLAIYPLRTTLAAAFHFLPGLAVVLVIVWYLKGFENLPALVSLVPSLALLFVFGWALATCMGVVNVVFQDTQHLAEVALNMLFYITPILCPPEVLRAKKLDAIVDANPLSAFLELVRQPILEARIPAPETFATASLMAGGAALVALAVLWRFERRLIFYL